MNAQTNFSPLGSLGKKTSNKMLVCILLSATGTGTTAIATINNSLDPTYELTGTGSSLEYEQHGKLTAAATPQEMLTTVAKDLKLSVTAIADLFDVSRTAVYKWKEGGAMGGSKLKLLEGLHEISAEIANLEIPLVASKLTSPLAEGKSLILMILEGEDPRIAFDSFKERVTYSRSLTKS